MENSLTKKIHHYWPELVVFIVAFISITFFGLKIFHAPVSESAQGSIAPTPIVTVSDVAVSTTSSLATQSPVATGSVATIPATLLPSPDPIVLAVTSTFSPVTTFVTVQVKGLSKTDSYKVPVDKQVTVAEVMQDAAQQGLVMTTKDYGGSLGLFVEMLNGTKNDSAKRLYWSLYVNGKLSSLGISSTKVKPGDSVSWVYQSLSL